MIDSNSLLMVGEIVEVLKGRDRGKYAIVIEILDERYLFTVDGDKRKFDSPKKKNIRHLRSTGYISKEITANLNENNRVSNAKLRYILQDYISKHLIEDEKKGE